MKDCDSRSWIGGEGLPSRDQVKEKREQRQRGWFLVRGSHREICVQVFCTCMWVTVETIAYICKSQEDELHTP
jgi:hypothetical protein